MTDAMMALGAFLEKSPDAAVLREMTGFAAERLMDPEVQGGTGAGHGERSAARLVQEADIHGILPRSVGDLIKALGMSGISKSQLSRKSLAEYPDGRAWCVGCEPPSSNCH